MIKVLEIFLPSASHLIGQHQHAGHDSDLFGVQQAHRGSIRHEGGRLHPTRTLSQVEVINLLFSFLLAILNPQSNLYIGK